jgi:hypothetical protein
VSASDSCTTPQDTLDGVPRGGHVISAIGKAHAADGRKPTSFGRGAEAAAPAVANQFPKLSAVEDLLARARKAVNTAGTPAHR